MVKLPIYLDNNATTPIDSRVVNVMHKALVESFGNPSSSTHTFGWYADEQVEIAREEIAKLIKASPEEIIFTSGATEALNLAIFGFVKSYKKLHAKKPHLITCSTEHKAVLDTLSSFPNDEIDLTILGVSAEGKIDLEQLKSAFQVNTALLIFMFANNEIGTLHPIDEISKIAKKNNCALLCDATQACGKLEIDVAKVDIDYLCLSAHKFHGPKGIGILYQKKNSLELTPLIYGGGQERGLIAGTLNTASIIGMGESAKIINNELNQIQEHLLALSKYFLLGLKNSIGDIELNGCIENRLPGNINIYIPKVTNTIFIGQIQTKVALSISSACQSASKTPSHVLNALGLSEQRQKSSIRLGFSRFNTIAELDYTIDLFDATIKKLR